MTLNSLTQIIKDDMFDFLKKRKNTKDADTFKKNMWYNHRQSLKRIKSLEHSVNELLLSYENGKDRGRSQEKPSRTPYIGGQDG